LGDTKQRLQHLVRGTVNSGLTRIPRPYEVVMAPGRFPRACATCAADPGHLINRIPGSPSWFIALNNREQEKMRPDTWRFFPQSGRSTLTAFFTTPNRTSWH